MFLHIACLLSLAVAPPLDAATFTKPRCQSRCGNLQVPYPFGVGIGSNCSMDPDFDIYCSTSSNPSRPYLANNPFEVIKIAETEIYVKDSSQQQAVACYDMKFNNLTEYSQLRVTNSQLKHSINGMIKFTCTELRV
ncbi:wall-associated receptor kinase 2-like [Abeliophyllum distichum]|uniref:Wall-associated receptor kinase 2-like n=1 Tax=Abeliophyllum distichum TaxID=126358 RepID=A0ABD1VPA4_9LAMI